VQGKVGMKTTIRTTGKVLPVVALMAACSSACERGNAGSIGKSDSTSNAAVPTNTSRTVTPVAVEEQPRDSVIVEEKLAWARAQKLDTLPIGEIIARLGRTFVGAPYTPGTLEVPGPERLVVNLREFDCVTFIENMLAMARVVRAGSGGYAAFKKELLHIRYRHGRLADYPSRLHYFSEWIADNEAKGIVKNITRELGGVQDTEAIDFMTKHVSAYRQLADTAVVSRIREIERRLSATPRYVIPEDRIAAVANRIHDGDIIGAASNVTGLDVAHTGIALWLNGKLHLMHAPLIGTVVEISKLPLAERIKSIEKQDGIMVARPL
jgi:N-acetylmuramoyl-L-alanine amidase-like protein